MGLAIQQEQFKDEDYTDFMQKVQCDLRALKELLQRPGFGEGPETIGAEFEFYLVDENGDVLPRNDDVATKVQDPNLQVELCKFNLECNLTHQLISGKPFSTIEAEMEQMLAKVRQAAKQYGGRPISVGILPTLKSCDFTREMMTDTARYRVLASGIKKILGKPFSIDIEGDDPLQMTVQEMTLEGANASFQFHWRVSPSAYARAHNAVQWATPLALAVGANSPSLLGHFLWHETRVCLFQQTIDSADGDTSEAPGRVTFGDHWTREGAWELFAESTENYPPLIPIVSKEDPISIVRAGGIPGLDELKLHHGTTWPWNRAIYDDHDGGHLRIEMRALPSGPTCQDMLANAAFLLGLAQAHLEDIDALVTKIPFKIAKENFYQAAKNGINAQFMWPDSKTGKLTAQSVQQIVSVELSRAEQGLSALGVEQAEIKRFLNLIEQRIKTGMNGAEWQRKKFQHLSQSLPREKAFHQLVEDYIEAQASGLPVTEWPL